MAKISKRSDPPVADSSVGSSTRLQALLGGGARQVLNRLRESSANMPAGEAFYDELLAAGVLATCLGGAELEPLDLLYFAGAGRLACVRELLAAGAPVESITCRQLVDCGVGGGGASYCPRFSEAQNSYGPWSTPWQACVREMAQAGLPMGASKGENPLIDQASSRSGEGHLEFFVSLGADVDERDGKGRTALMRMAEMGSTELMDRLLALGADPWARDKNGRDARAWALSGDEKNSPQDGELSAVEEFDRVLAKWELAQIESSSASAPSGAGVPRL